MSNRRIQPATLHLAALWAATTLSLNATLADAQSSALTWTPYDVAVSIHGDGGPELSPALLNTVKEEISAAARTLFGTAWRLRFSDSPDFVTADRFVSAADVPLGETAMAKSILGAALTEEKRIVVVLSRRETTFTAEAREWDDGLRSAGSTIRRRTPQRSLLPMMAAEAATAAFRLVARIDDVRQNTAVMRLQGGSLLPDATRNDLLRTGDGFVPLLRKLDGDGRPIGVDVVRWTLLAVNSAAGAKVECRISSGVRSPLGARRRGRSERWAISAGRPERGTSLTMTAQHGGAALAGCVVHKIGDDGRSQLLGATDERGRIEIPPADGRVETLLVTSRYLPLARFPIVAGLQGDMTAPLPADLRLFDAEHWLADWQAEFTDLFVARRVLAALAELRIEREEFDAAKSLLMRLDQIDSPADRIEALEVRRRVDRRTDALEGKLADSLYAKSLTFARTLDDAPAIMELKRRLASTQKK